MIRGMNIVNRDSPLYDVLMLLADPGELKKNIDALVTEQDKMQEKIDRFAMAEEIEKVHARLGESIEASRVKAEKANTEVEILLEKTQETCARTIADADKQAAEIFDSAQEKLADANERQKVATKNRVDSERTLGELDQREKQIARQEADLERKLAGADELQTQLLKEKSDFAAVRETLKAVTG